MRWVIMVLFLTGCAGSEEDVSSDQKLSGWYCLLCAGLEGHSVIEAHEQRQQVKPPIINKPEK